MARGVFYGALIIASGVVLMKTTTPTEEQVYNRLSPELKAKVDEYRKMGLAEKRMEFLKAAAETDELLYRKDPHEVLKGSLPKKQDSDK